jgi:hypothetical protein
MKFTVIENVYDVVYRVNVNVMNDNDEYDLMNDVQIYGNDKVFNY